MIRRSGAFLKACRVLGVDPATAFEDIARRYHAVAQTLRADAGSNDETATAKLVAANGAWGRIKYEAMKRRARLTREAPENYQPFARCTWPQPPTMQSRAFAGYELRPTEHARCYRVIKNGVQLLTLHRHPDDPRLLYARNERGHVVRVTGVTWWTDAEGELRPFR